jgi:uncharacterized protein (DUF2249 family)
MLLDLRTLVPAERCRAALGAFGALNLSEQIELVDDLDPRPLLFRLQLEHAERFDWVVLEDRPERWRVVVTRLDTSGEKPTAHLSRDHRRLDALLEQLRAGDADAAVPLSTGLRHHLRAEEDVLFPAFLAAGGPYAPIQVMHAEHAEIDGLLDRLPDPHAIQSLASLLTRHNAKEEGFLYPGCDRLVHREPHLLIRRMQAI